MRKSKTVTVTAEGRDKGKVFFLREMAARPAEKWANRCFLALANARLDLPAGFGRRSMSDLAQIANLIGSMRFTELEPLMDELMSCIRRVEDARIPEGRALVDNGAEGDDIEEVETRHFLRSEVIDLHVGFTLPATIFNLIAAGSMMTEIRNPPNTPTSRRRSGQSSAPD